MDNGGVNGALGVTPFPENVPIKLTMKWTEEYCHMVFH